MPRIVEIIDFINRYLSIDNFKDYCFNGLQVEGRSIVEHIVTGVSANLELFEKAQKKHADLILVHHGLFWKPGLLRIHGFNKSRIKFLLDNNINLAGYHLPLDFHPEIGNSISLLRILNADSVIQQTAINGHYPVFIGNWLNPVNFEQLFDLIGKIATPVVVFPFGKKKIFSVGVVTGQGQKQIEDAIELGLDLFISGETSEFVMSMAKEAKINYIGLGHYNTERLGIINLGNLVSNHFGIPVDFIDIPNPV